MGWIGKLFKLAMLAIILCIVALIAFIVFANPNSYKPRITELLQTYTGLPFKIEGDIEWTLRPISILKLQDLTLADPTDSNNPAVKIKDVTLRIDMGKALSNHIVITNLAINNPVINWMQTKQIINSEHTPAKPCTIEKLTVKNGSITIQDPKDQMNWLLKDLSITADSFILNANQELPSLHLEGELVNVAHNVQYSLETTAKFDAAKHVLTLDPLKMIWNETPMQGTAIINQFDTDPLISGNFAMAPTDIGALLRKLDPYFANSDTQINHTMQVETAYAYTPKDQLLDLTKFNLQIDKGLMSGDVKLGFIAPYRAEFTLSAENFNFAPLGMLGSAFLPALHTMNTVPVDFLKQIVIQGKFTGTKVAFNDAISIDQMQMEITGQGGVVNISPVLINAYGGTHDLALNIDVTGPTTQVQINEQATKVDLEPWLKLSNNDRIISGSANLKAQLQGGGDNIDAIKQNLSGTISLFITDGVLYGVDITRLMQFSTQTVTDIFKELAVSPAANMNVLAIKQSSNWIQTQADNPKTKFDHFELSVEIGQGVSKQASVTLTNNAIELKGSGDFRLSDQFINFATTTISRIEIPADVQVLGQYMKATPLNMTITGTINRPVFGPNVQGYVTTILKTSIADLQQQALIKMLAASPANIQTDKTPSEIFLNSLQSLNK